METWEDCQSRAVFTVTDTGLGIADDERHRLFQAFEQLDASNTRRHGGVGLGLALVARIARAAGGEVRLESRRGFGSSFRLALPFDAPSNEARSTDSTFGGEQRPLEGVRVLLLDDAPVGASLLGRTLEKYGARVTVEASTYAGFEALLRNPHDVVLLDSLLPGRRAFLGALESNDQRRARARRAHDNRARQPASRGPQRRGGLGRRGQAVLARRPSSVSSSARSVASAARSPAARHEGPRRGAGRAARQRRAPSSAHPAGRGQPHQPAARAVRAGQARIRRRRRVQRPPGGRRLRGRPVRRGPDGLSDARDGRVRGDGHLRDLEEPRGKRTADPRDDGELARGRSRAISGTVGPASGDSLRVASFNIQVFGISKMEKRIEGAPTSKMAGRPVVEILASIVRQFDVVAIQEIRARDQTVLPRFVEIVNSDGSQYDFVIGPRRGRTSSKEQYAFVFNQRTVEIDRRALYEVEDPDDLLHREPLVCAFRARGVPAEDAFTFTLINIHTDPDEVGEELNVLDDVYRAVRNDGRHEDDVILLGDLNADEEHLGELGELSDITWAIAGVPSNTRGTKLYDNLIFQRSPTAEFSGRAGVLDMMKSFGLTQEEALQVSDHQPVWAEFSRYEGGQSGRFAEGAGSIQVE